MSEDRSTNIGLQKNFHGVSGWAVVALVALIIGFVLVVLWRLGPVAQTYMTVQVMTTTGQPRPNAQVVVAIHGKPATQTNVTDNLGNALIAIAPEDIGQVGQVTVIAENCERMMLNVTVQTGQAITMPITCR